MRLRFGSGGQESFVARPHGSSMATRDFGQPQIPCIHRTADGAFRGAYIGIAWGLFFGPSHVEVAVTKSWWPVRASSAVSQLGRFTAIHSVGFAAFLGAYNALQCTCERIFGSNSGLTSTATGGILGALGSAMLYTRPTGPRILGGSVGAAVTCTAVNILVNSRRDR